MVDNVNLSSYNDLKIKSKQKQLKLRLLTQKLCMFKKFIQVYKCMEATYSMYKSTMKDSKQLADIEANIIEFTNKRSTAEIEFEEIMVEINGCRESLDEITEKMYALGLGL